MITGVRTHIVLATLVGLGAACDEPESVLPTRGAAPIEEAKPAEAPEPAITAAPPVVDTPMELHIVATRRGPIALSVGHGVEVALAGVLPIALRTSEALVVDPRHREGLAELTERLPEPTVELVRFGGRWPHEATIVARVAPEYAEGSFTRAIRWNGSTWERDDPVVHYLKRYWTPLGPFELGTTLVLPAVEHTSPGKRGWMEALERAQPKQLARRLVDGTTTPGPLVPPEEYARIASTADGWVFAGVRGLYTWSPGATQWQSHALPDGPDGWINGFLAIASDDVYAYGTYNVVRPEERRGYIAHWDGKTWTAMPAPKCSYGIMKLARGRTASWAYCAYSGFAPHRPPWERELWRTDAKGEWQRIALEVDGSRVRARALATDKGPPQLSETRPRATDIGITADDTLWISMSARDAVWNETPGTWLLARSSGEAAVLELPADDELYAPPRK